MLGLRYSSTILDLGNRCRLVVSFTLRPLYSQGKAPNINWIGGWVGPKAGLEAVKERKLSPLLGS
jgi:hypothetical protein